MFEYQSEIIHIGPKGFKFVKTVVNHADIAKLDELIAKRAAEGWELVTYSSMVDNVVGCINIIVTFKRTK
jgi:hypothetical protein